MLKIALSLSVFLHGFVFAMLYLCPEGLYVGAQKGGSGSVAVEIYESRTQFTPPTRVKSKSRVVETKSVKKTASKKIKVAKEPSKSIRKTPLTNFKAKGAGFDLRNLKSNLSPAMQKFFYQLRRDIEQNKRYPKKAKRFRQRGEVAVKFSVTKEGKIVNVVVEKPSPYETLNNSARSAVQALMENSYPLPVEVSSSQIQVILPIRYSL